MTEKERELLDSALQLALAGVPEDEREHVRKIGANLADELRRALPDVPDRLISRLLANITGMLAYFGTRGVTIAQAARGLGFAALDLANVDLEDPPNTHGSGPAVSDPK